MTITELDAAISELPPELQIRVNVIAEMLRGMLCADVKFETELAMFVVQSEIEESDEETDCPAELGYGQLVQ